MTPGLFALVIGAAFLHASWNAVLRGGDDRLWAITIMSVPATLAALVWIAFHAPPNPAAWPFLAASALLQIGYSFALTEAYRTGELAQVYPIARGSAPLLVVLGAAVFAHERPPASSLLAVVLISGGILALSRKLDRAGGRAIAAALTTGACIASYTTVDGMGVRLAGASITYGACMLVLYGTMMPAIFAVLRGPAALLRPRPGMARAFGGGALSLLTYATMVFALSRASIASVAALRETSVLFAALLGHVTLGERVTPRRLAACLVIAGGVAAMAVG